MLRKIGITIIREGNAFVITAYLCVGDALIIGILCFVRGIKEIQHVVTEGFWLDSSTLYEFLFQFVVEGALFDDGFFEGQMALALLNPSAGCRVLPILGLLCRLLHMFKLGLDLNSLAMLLDSLGNQPISKASHGSCQIEKCSSVSSQLMR